MTLFGFQDSGFPSTEEVVGSSNLGSDQSNTGMLDLLKDYAKVSSRTDVPHIASPEVGTSMCYPFLAGFCG